MKSNSIGSIILSARIFSVLSHSFSVIWTNVLVKIISHIYQQFKKHYSNTVNIKFHSTLKKVIHWKHSSKLCRIEHVSVATAVTWKLQATKLQGVPPTMKVLDLSLIHICCERHDCVCIYLCDSDLWCRCNVLCT